MIVDTAVSSQKRQKSVLDTDNPYQVACLHMFTLAPGEQCDGYVVYLSDRRRNAKTIAPIFFYTRSVIHMAHLR